MKKKQIANLVMVAIIVVIFAVGVLSVGGIQGWFDRADGTQAVLTEIRGIVSIERNGVSYAVEEDTVLRANDKITCSPGATVRIRTADGSLTLANSAEIEIADPASDRFAAKIDAGEVFVNTAVAVHLTFDGQEVAFADTVSLLSVRSGAQTVSVFAGNVGQAHAGQTLDRVNGEINIGTLAIQSLNDFTIAQMRAVNETVTLCFTNADLDQLEADRWAKKQEQLMGAQPIVPGNTKPSTEATAPAAETTEPATETPRPGTTAAPSPTDPPATEPSKAATPTTTPPATKSPTKEPSATEAPTTQPPATESSKPPVTAAPATKPSKTEVPATEPSATAAPTTKPPATESPTTEPPATEAPATNPPVTAAPTTEPPTTNPPATEPPVPAYDGFCTITIRCDTILDNWDDLNPAKAGYVPSNGVILPAVTVGFHNGETVFDVLRRACDVYSIQLEYSWTPLYDSYYIEGINHLYEFDCGEQSGWMYKVNEWFPNYGCSSYTVGDGDLIVWCYTCKGLGTDVGDDWMAQE